MKIKEWIWVDEEFYSSMEPENFFYTYFVGENRIYDDNGNDHQEGYYFSVSDDTGEVFHEETRESVEEAKLAAEKWHYDYLMAQFEK